MADKKLVIAVEATAAMGPFWQTILHDYLEKIIRSFCGTEVTAQKPSSAPNFELSLVTFTAHGAYSAYLVGRSGWTRDIDTFLQWLSAIPFAGGGFCDAAIAEGLADALMMLSSQNGSQSQQSVDSQRHCILVAASNPYSLPTPVYRPQLKNLEKSEIMEGGQSESRLSDAEAVAKSFAQLSISLSVICPKQLPKLRAIYNSGKRNPRAPDPPIDTAKNPYYLILISENFMEARATLSRPGTANLVPNLSPVKMDVTSVPSVSVPPPSASIPLANGSAMNRQQPISVVNITPATVKVEPTTMPSMVPGPTFSHIPSVPRAVPQGVPSLQTSSPLSASQEILSANDNVQDLKPMVSSMAQSLRPVGPAAANVSILNNLSTARQVMNSAALAGGTSMGLQPMGPTPMAIHMSNMISTGMTSSVPANQTVLSSGQPGIMGGSGTTQVAQNSGSATFASGTSNMSQALGTLQVGGVSMSQPVSGMGQPVSGMGQGSIPGGAQMVQGGSGMGMNQNMMSGMGPPGNGSMMPTPGMGQPGMQSLGLNNNSVANMPLSQQTSNALQSAQSKYVKVWEGNLSGQRQGQPVFITRLEGYRSSSASETLAANWPSTMQIVRLISQDHMNNKQYVGKADFLVFRAMNQHGFLGQLQEKKLDMVVFKPQISSQQQQPQQHPQLQQQQLQQLQQQQQQQSHPQLQQQQQQQMPQQMQQQQQQQMQQQQQQQQQMQQQHQQQQIPQQQQMQPQHQQQMPQQQQMQLQQQQQMPQQMQQQQMPQQMQQQQMPQQMQQQQQIPQQTQQQQHIPQMQQPQQQQPQQQMGQGYVQGTGRSQLVSQGQVASQAPPLMPGGGGYLN